MKNPGDLKWVLPAWAGFLYALGGYIFKAFRRIGIPLSVCLVAWLYGPRNAKNGLLLVGQFLLLWGVLTLPLTLIGDKMTPVNLSWAFAVGGFNVLALTPLCFMAGRPWLKFQNLLLWVALSTFLYGLSVVASNTWPWFEHKWTETLAGLLIGGAAADTINDETNNSPS